MSCPQYLTLDPISSTGTRDIAIDITYNLETDEFLTEVAVVSSQPTLLAISNVGWNDQPINENGRVIGSRKAAVFSMAGLIDQATANVDLELTFTGSNGSSDAYTLVAQIRDTL